MRRVSIVLASVFALLMVVALSIDSAIAFTTAPGFAATNFVTGFATALFNGRTIGPIGLAFDASGNNSLSMAATTSPKPSR